MPEDEVTIPFTVAKKILILVCEEDQINDEIFRKVLFNVFGNGSLTTDGLSHKEMLKLILAYIKE